MPALLPALLILAILGLATAWMLRANPSNVARLARIVLLTLGGIGVGGLLVFVVRFLPAMLPEVLGLAGLVVAALVARALRRKPSGGFSSPGTGQRTEVKTTLFEAWIDHATGDVGGKVLNGRFSGRTFDDLADAELLTLHGDCGHDVDSLKVLEAYLDRRLGTDWRNSRQSPDRPAVDMDRVGALAALGLAEGASDEEIRTAHRRLIQRVHPDVGGSADLAARINRAKDVLLGS